jgi:hypothetical protein
MSLPGATRGPLRRQSKMRVSLGPLPIIAVHTKGENTTRRDFQIGLQKRAAIFLQHRGTCQGHGVEKSNSVVEKQNAPDSPTLCESGALLIWVVPQIAMAFRQRVLVDPQYALPV